MKFMKHVTILLSLVVLVVVSCSEDSSTGPAPNSAPEIKAIRMPDFIELNKAYKIEAQVADPQGVRDVRYVLLEVLTSPNSQAVVTDTLRDDGGYLDPNDADAIAGDGTFTNMITVPATITQGELRFVFQAVDQAGHTSQPLEKKITTELNSPPQILAITGPESLPSGFASALFQVTVADSNGSADISAVTMWVWSKNLDQTPLFDDGSHGDPVAGDQVYSLRVDSSFAARKQGLTELKFAAVDRYNSSSPTVVKAVAIENKKPALFNLSVPDSIQRPTSGKNAFIMQVSVSDPQSLGDIAYVGLVTMDPSGSYGTVATPENPLLLVDNGNKNLGDEIAGDGIYSLGASISPTNQLGVWTFIFQAEDWVNNKSDSLVHKITVFQ